MKNNINTLLNSLSDIHKIRKADKKIAEINSKSDNTMTVGTPSVVTKPIVITQKDLEDLVEELAANIDEYYVIDSQGYKCLPETERVNLDKDGDYNNANPFYARMHWQEENGDFYEIILSVWPHSVSDTVGWVIDLPTDDSYWKDDLVNNGNIKVYKRLHNSVTKQKIELFYEKDYIFADNCSLSQAIYDMNVPFPLEGDFYDENDEDFYDENDEDENFDDEDE